MDNSDAGKKIRRMKTLRKYLFIFSIIGIQLINFIIFYIVQNANSIVMAFQLKKQGQVYWTLDNFKNVYNQFFGEGSTHELRLALVNTLKFFGLGLLLFPIAFLTSYFMFKKIHGYKIFQLVFFLPSIVSSVVWATLYKEVVGINGPIVKMMQFFGRTDEVFVLLEENRFALTTVMMYSVWFGIAGNFILYGGAFSRIPMELLEAGKIDGITWGRELVSIIVPLLFPTIGTLLLLQLTGIFTSSGQILLLTGGAGNTNTISYLIFSQVLNGGRIETSNTYNYAACVGVCFSVLTIPIVFLVRWLLNKIEDVEY